MDIQTRLTDDMKTALKAGQKDRLQVIRMVLSDVKNIDLNPAKPTAEQVVAAYAKKLRKSMEEYEKLGKADEVTKLKFEIGVVDEYLPKKLGAEETGKLVDAFLLQHTFTEKDAGKAMGAFLKLHGSSVDGAIVNPIIRQKLAGNE